MEHITRRDEKAMSTRFGSATMRSAAAYLAVAGALGLAACGGDDGSPGAAAGGGGGEAAADGGAKALTVGMPQPFGGDQGTLALTAGLKCWAQGDNATVKTADANIDPNKQITDFNSFLAQQVDGIVTIPLNDQGLFASYTKAEQQGVATVTVGPPAEGSPAGAVVGDFNDDLGKASADALADALPEGGKVLIIGGPPQILAVSQRVDAFKAQAKTRGLEVLEQQNSMKATPDDARTIAASLFSKHRDADAIWGVNSDIASGGGLAARAAGKPDLKVVGIAASPVAIKQLQAGNIDMIVDDRSYESGEDAGRAIRAQAAGREFTPAPFEVKVYDKETAGEYVSFDKRCAS